VPLKRKVFHVHLSPSPAPQAEGFGSLSPAPHDEGFGWLSPAPHDEGFGSPSPVPQEEGAGLASSSFEPQEEPQEEEFMLYVFEAR